MAYNKRNYRKSSSDLNQEAKATWALVTEKFIASLEKGRIPWRKPWSHAENQRPYNPSTKTQYSGINQILLGITEYADPRFMTFKQVSELGGKVKKGEKGHIVVFYKPITVEDKETGEEKEIRMVKHYWVFNVEQCEGLELPELPKPDIKPNEVIADAQNLLEGYLTGEGITLATGGQSAFYSPVRDHIQMPELGLFFDSSFYYQTAFHEAIHSTGHTKRLGRFTAETNHSFGSDDYSREELVAEVGAAFLMADLGLDSPELQENSEAYIGSWIRAFKNDPKMILWASAKANQAATMILESGK